MLLTSFPTLFAYAPWSLESFVVRLILKNTSSPDAETTWIRGTHVQRDIPIPFPPFDARIRVLLH